MEILQSGTLLRKLIHIGGSDHIVAMHADIAIALIIGNDDHDIGGIGALGDVPRKNKPKNQAPGTNNG